MHYYTHYTLDFYHFKTLMNFKGVFYDFLMCFDVQLYYHPLHSFDVVLLSTKNYTHGYLEYIMTL